MIHEKSAYAILSHVWDKEGEMTFEDLERASMSMEPPLNDLQLSNVPSEFDKVWRACELARAHGFQYIWIDTCCIDKRSSAELTEAINSMYGWYGCADVCYAFLRDVDAEKDQPLGSQLEISPSDAADAQPREPGQVVGALICAGHGGAAL